MMNRSIQSFLKDTYGQAAWDRIAEAAKLEPDDFDSAFTSKPGQTEAALASAVACLAKPREMLLEDLGTYLVSHPHTQPIRRLLRFGGPTFVEFLFSLDELPDRARLAVPDLELPGLELIEHDATSYSLRVHHPVAGFGYVLMGILRALADDYGALALLDHGGRRDQTEAVLISLAEVSFSEGRRFDLRLQAG